MKDIDLMPNEGIVAQFDSVWCDAPDFKGSQRGELSLTNQALVFTYTQPKMFAKDVEHAYRWPLRDVKVVDGRPQLIFDKGDSHECNIVLRQGKLVLRMDSHQELARLGNAVNHALTGSDEDIVGAPKTFISDIANTLSGATREFTQAFGFGSRPSATVETVSAVCEGCGASLHGKSGGTVTCEYCCVSRQL
ncbi:hypothetical protein [Bifidobacterium cuniculi]|uniref:Uncharacterized protein n=1 Tax=Bifidobacterium cuniculi TaxID=1688 RepID=A0A087AZQ3_9BIFI|nr:hypothetical protein [Bifidobacterium cuniculi]KFI64253.1 hypothetical protein BCUN_2118 [Bifidobacterium cuniculi]